MTEAPTKARKSTKQAPKVEPQAPSMTRAEQVREFAQNTSKVWVNFIKPIGSTTNGFSFPGRDAVKVLIDGEFKLFSNDGAWYDIWDSRDGSNPLGNDFNAVLAEHRSVFVKLYWEWSSREDNLLTLPQYNEKTGKTFKKTHFKNAPRRLVLAFDILMHSDGAPSKDAEVPESEPYGADCDNQEEIPF